MTIKIVKKVLTIEIIPVILKEKEPTCITIICPETFKPPPVTLQIPLPVMEQLGQKLGSSDYSEPSINSFSFIQQQQAMYREIASLTFNQTIWEIVPLSITDMPKVAAT